MRKILLSLGVIALAFSAHPCFAEEPQQICPDNVEDMLSNYEHKADFDYYYPGNDNPINAIASYRAAGKIYFLKKCADSETLCKTGSYIIKGDYFVAVPKMNGYYCAIYTPDSYKTPKASGLIKGGDFTETKFNEYKALNYRNSAGSWIRKQDNIEKFVRFYHDVEYKRIVATGQAHNLEDDYDIEFDKLWGDVFKTGPQSFINTTREGLFDVYLKAGKLTLKSFDENRTKKGQYDACDGRFSGTYIYAAKPKP